MTKPEVFNAVSEIIAEHGIAAVTTALREYMGGGPVTGLAPDESQEWNATLVKLEELARKIA